MRFLLPIIIAFAGLLGNACANEKGLPATITYAHWNIGHFAMGKSCNPTIPASESAMRAKEYEHFIKDLKADVFGCSEFDSVFDQAGGKTVDKLFSSYDTANIGPKNTYQSNAIFTKGLKRVQCEIVNYTNRCQSTYFIDATYLMDGQEVHFVQTHLDWNSNAKATRSRPMQIQQLIGYFASKEHVVIAGDFNVYAAAEYLPFQQAGYQLASCGANGPVQTVEGDSNSFRAIDNLLAKGFSIQKVRTADDEYKLSDHKLLLCTLRLLP